MVVIQTLIGENKLDFEVLMKKKNLQNQVMMMIVVTLEYHHQNYVEGFLKILKNQLKIRIKKYKFFNSVILDLKQGP